METLQKIWKKFGQNFEVEKAPTIEQVAIFGFADAKVGDKVYKEAFEVASALAQAGYTVVDGGGPGVMEAASRGAKVVGGKVVGVTFYPNSSDGLDNFEGRDPNNPIDKEIKTTSYVERTLTLMKEGQVYVVFNGASGTMSEFAMAWGLARIYFGHHKPLILYGKFWKRIMKALRKSLLLRPEEGKVYKIVDSPKGVLKAIKEFEEDIAQGRYTLLQTSMENDR